MNFSTVAAWVVVASALSAQAQEAGQALPLWELGIVGGAVSTPAYPASTERVSRALALPIFFYRGEVLRADRDSVGARLVHTRDYDFDVGFSASLPSSSSDIAVRRGMPDLGTLVEFGPRLKLTLARPSPSSRLRLELPVRAVLEVNGGVRGQGLAFEPELGYESAALRDGWRLSASGSLVLGDRQLNQYFYGVSPELATAGRSAYEARAGLLATRLAASASKDQTPHLRVFGFVRHESYGGSANSASPLFLRSNGTSVGVGLIWTLVHSERRAAD
ncbi:MAG: MipA/OmpV family protein [Polaromonas sp.]|nr:MipA/OmpV family protein [Polaromonas sp.]